MTRPTPLRLVSEPAMPSRMSEARELADAAKAAAAAMADAMIADMDTLAAHAVEVANLTSLPPGVCDMARRLADDLSSKAGGMNAIMHKVQP